MSFTIRTINKFSKFVIVEHEGRLTREEFEEARAIAKRKLDENRWSNLLVDLRGTVKGMPIVDIYYVIGSNANVLPNVRIALLFTPELETEGRFAEDVATNRSVRLKSFIDYEQAVAWLTGGST
jgi:hypothetical protein